MKSSVRNSLWIVGIAVVLIGAVLLYLLVVVEPHGFALGDTSVRVIGRIVDDQTGNPVPGAVVLILDSERFEDNEEDLAEARRYVEEWADAQKLYPKASRRNPYGGLARTDATGRFDVTLSATFCTAFGPGITPEEPPPFHGARLILVEALGFQRTFFSTENGTWRVLAQGEEGDPYAVADVRTLRLPPLE